MTSLDSTVALYTDGGCVRANPSKIGGTWAWCAVNAFGKRIAESSGFRPWLRGDNPVGITNNFMELMAAVLALEAMPGGWSGTLYTDSSLTLHRLTTPNAPFRNIPIAWVRRAAAAVSDLGAFRVVLLSGHPTREELRQGFSVEGKHVSEHNRWADKECARLAAIFTPPPGMRVVG